MDERKAMYDNDTADKKSALTTTEAPPGVCASQPPLFMLYSRTLPVMIQREFAYEVDAQIVAESIARSNRGHQISIFRLVASVCEPLPPLQWSDGRPAGDGQDRGLIPPTRGSGDRKATTGYSSLDSLAAADRKLR